MYRVYAKLIDDDWKIIGVLVFDTKSYSSYFIERADFKLFSYDNASVTPDLRIVTNEKVYVVYAKELEKMGVNLNSISIKGERKNVICFYNPNKENGYLSNWYLCNFICDDVLFSSMEQYMMWGKAKLFNDIEMMNKILSTNDPAKLKKYGRKVKNFDEDTWNREKVGIIQKGLLSKFTQNSDLLKKLKEVPDDYLFAECVVDDKIWSAGLSINDENRFYPNMWKGQNLLGYSIRVILDIINGK